MNLVIGITITSGIDLDVLGAALENAFKRGLKNLANAALGEWQDEAGRQLHRTRRKYMDALKTHVVSDDEIEVILHHPDEKINWVVTALEVGYKEIHLKETHLVDSSHAAYHWSALHPTKPGAAKAHPPFIDVPFRTGPAMEQKKPSFYRRMSPGSKSPWVHPGFRPVGTGGLKTPIREHVKEYIEKEAVNVFSPLIARITL